MSAQQFDVLMAANGKYAIKQSRFHWKFLCLKDIMPMMQKFFPAVAREDLSRCWSGAPGTPFEIWTAGAEAMYGPLGQQERILLVWRVEQGDEVKAREEVVLSSTEEEDLSSDGELSSDSDDEDVSSRELVVQAGESKYYRCPQCKTTVGVHDRSHHEVHKCKQRSLKNRGGRALQAIGAARSPGTVAADGDQLRMDQFAKMDVVEEHDNDGDQKFTAVFLQRTGSMRFGMVTVREEQEETDADYVQVTKALQCKFLNGTLALTYGCYATAGGAWELMTEEPAQDEDELQRALAGTRSGQHAQELRPTTRLDFERRADELYQRMSKPVLRVLTDIMAHIKDNVVPSTKKSSTRDAARYHEDVIALAKRTHRLQWSVFAARWKHWREDYLRLLLVVPTATGIGEDARQHVLEARARDYNAINAYSERLGADPIRSPVAALKRTLPRAVMWSMYVAKVDALSTETKKSVRKTAADGGVYQDAFKLASDISSRYGVLAAKELFVASPRKPTPQAGGDRRPKKKRTHFAHFLA